MADTTPRLGLSELVAAQAQKHVTVNENLIMLDALCDCYLTSMALATPPSSPSDGDCYLVPSGATGDWVSYVGKIAYCIDSAWRYFTAFRGMRAYNAADGKFYFYTGTAFADVNTLSGFTEGTWTPVLTATTAPTGVTYTAQGGRYSKIGNTVFLQYGLKLSSVGSGGAGTVTISGLPFTAASYDGWLNPANACCLENLATSTNSALVRMCVMSASTNMETRLMDGGDTGLSYDQMTNSTAIAGEIFYTV